MSVIFKQNPVLFTLRWTARLLTVFNLFIIGLFLQGFEYDKVRLHEWFGLLLFPVGVVFGVFLAWWDELLGSLISLGSLAVFYIVYGYFVNGSVLQGWYFLFFGIPALLFLICHYFPNHKPTSVIKT